MQTAKRFALCSLALAITFLISFATLQGQYQTRAPGRWFETEVTAPDTPSSGFSAPWVDATTHIPSWKSSAGTVYQGVPYDSAGHAVKYLGVAVLPASTAAQDRIYRATAATTVNRCLDAGDSGGSATAWCISDGTNYRAFIVSNIDGTVSVPVGGSTNHATCWKAAGKLGYCSAVVDSSGVCGTCQ